jgi:hypothetical protein
VSSPYRNEIDALRERKATLESEIARLKAHASELDALRAQEQTLSNELADIEKKLGATNARRALPLLDQVKVASPCDRDWNEMLGDERVRYCLGCEKNVFNLSAMGREEAEALLRDRLGKELCVRFYQRTDGTIMTEDCPVGVKRKRRKKLALAVAGAGAMALAATSLMLKAQSGCRTMGEVAYQGQQPIDNGEGKFEMGDVAPTPVAPMQGQTALPVMGSAAPPTPVTPPRPLMGKPVAPVNPKMGMRKK